MNNYQHNTAYNTQPIQQQQPEQMHQQSIQYDQHGRPVTSLLNSYMVQEGIDRRYSQLILQELYDATQLNNEQLNMAADEIITSSTPKPAGNNSNFNNHNMPNPNVWWVLSMKFESLDRQTNERNILVLLYGYAYTSDWDHGKCYKSR